ncbi:Complex 1 LYR protein [Gossypium australe]|uniref:Complex 1 LYR protein n=1 Tax=Gossypium australe TaxID=47621 RepID=A0A5B6VGE8_9ROSI|nr:Complex 1 LYR protein [Gossypium australe]
MDLQGFLLRARVLKLYRQALRAARKAPHDSRGGNVLFYWLGQDQFGLWNEVYLKGYKFLSSIVIKE